MLIDPNTFTNREILEYVWRDNAAEQYARDAIRELMLDSPITITDWAHVPLNTDLIMMAPSENPVIFSGEDQPPPYI